MRTIQPAVRPRPRPRTLTLGICVWLICEVIAFLAVADHVGIAGAIGIGILTTLMGLAMLRRIGVNAIRSLKCALDGAEPTAGSLLDGSLAALGAVLLILPGFLSDLVGLALAAPSVRQWLARRFGAVAAPGRPTIRVRPGTVDLAPGDWRRVEEVEAWSDRNRAPGERRMPGG